MTTLDFENGKDADYAAEVKAKALADHETADETADEPHLDLIFFIFWLKTFTERNSFSSDNVF